MREPITSRMLSRFLNMRTSREMLLPEQRVGVAIDGLQECLLRNYFETRRGDV
jgi:hypothetical protein